MASEFHVSGDLEKSNAILKRVLNADPKFKGAKDQLARSAHLYRFKGKLEEAHLILKLILSFGTEYNIKQELLELGTLYRELGKFEVAFEIFIDVLDSDCECEKTKNQLEQLALFFHKPKKESAVFIKVLKADKYYKYALRYLARLGTWYRDLG